VPLILPVDRSMVIRQNIRHWCDVELLSTRQLGTRLYCYYPSVRFMSAWVL